MERMIPHKKLMPGIYQGTLEPADQKKDEAPRLIRTMKLDTGEAIRSQNETEVSIALAEEKKRTLKRAEAEAQKKPETNVLPAPKPIGRIIVVLVLLLIVTLLVLGYVYLLPKIKTIPLPDISIPSFRSDAPEPEVTTPVVPPLAPSLISAKSEQRFDITTQTQSQVLSGVASEVEQSVPQGEIKNIYFEESAGSVSSPISSSRLLVFLNISAPEILARSLEKPFMVGLLNEETSSATPFIILKVSSYEAGLVGMLEWESVLPSFFSTLFGMNSDGSPLPYKKFQDIVVAGKDSRILSGSPSGTIVYAFANPRTIVIAGSRGALERLLPIASKN